jgi:phosphoribosylformylglycinamidine synthase subunit PurSL
MSVLKEAGFLDLAEQELAALSRERGLSLSVEEMQAIQAYFRAQGRPPSDAELETLAQTWSEHCKHKTFRAAIEHVEKDEMGLERRRQYGDLLKETVMRVTQEVKRPWCLSVFKDNAGIVSFNGRDAVAFKAETHNHPSALEPYGGAGTGLGGVIRDVLGAGLGAKPIANTDVFCFAPLDTPPRSSPKAGGGLSPRRIFHGVVSGVRDYGNRMGIPTVSGAVYFDEGFDQNPLVFCGTVGLMPVDAVHKEVREGDRIVMVGGRVGRDGIHGATFSSDNLSEGIPSSVVQIGNPIVEKKMMDVLLQARDRRLYRGVTDCGAGGLSSAVGEMGEQTGADVRLERVPLKYEGLAPWEIWLSESQERMVLAVPPEDLEELKAVFAAEDVECSDIGVFAGGRLKVSHGGETIVDLDTAFLHDGVPKRRMKSFWSPPSYPRDVPRARDEERDAEKSLLSVLARPTVASKEWIIRQYDHEVQGRTVLKPLAGPAGRGPADAVALRVGPDTFEGVMLSAGLNPHYSRWDAYWMAASALDEAVRNLVAAGARLDKISLLDNFCGGDPTDPKALGELVRASQACYDIARAYGAPFISGKDSLYNQFVDRKTGRKKAIPTTLLISAMAWTDDIRKLVTMDLKKVGDPLFVLGLTKDELGGSQYGLARGAAFGEVPRVNPQETLPLYHALSEAIDKGLVAACHDCSEGGLGVALAEMALAGQSGVHADLRRVPQSADLKAEARTDKVLFSESNGRFVVEVPAKSRRAFLALFEGLPAAQIGDVRESRKVSLTGMKGKALAWSVADLEKAWTGGLKP